MTASDRPAGLLRRRSSARTRTSNRSLLRELPVLVVVALLIALLIKTFVVQAFVIPSSSMEDTLLVHDKVLVNKLVYHFRSIHPGDIIVFNGAGTWNPAPAATSGGNLLARLYDDTLRKFFDSVGGLFGTPIGQTDYIKRVIGVPGDHVVCCNAAGDVTVNGVPLNESSYLYPGNKSDSAIDGIDPRFNVTVPSGYLWVLGDHRAISDDSRGHESYPGNGMVLEKEVIGRAFLVAWPPSQWRILSIPATFRQKGITTTGGKIAALEGGQYGPAAAGLAGAVPLTWLQRRLRLRRRRAAPKPGQTPEPGQWPQSGTDE